MDSATVNTEEWALRLNRDLIGARARIAALEAQLAERVKVENGESLADEYRRLVSEYNEPDTDGTRDEAWNLIADFAIANYGTILSALEATPPAPKVTATHRHKNRGSEYSVLGQAQVQCSDGLTDYEVVTVYVGTDGQMWVRRKSEFEDGRFESLTAAQEAGKS